LRQELPEGFQRSEFLLKRGQIDRIVTREELPDMLVKLLEYLSPTRCAIGPAPAPRPADVAPQAPPAPPASAPASHATGESGAPKHRLPSVPRPRLEQS